MNLGNSIRFRALDGDKLVLSAAATARGQTLSAFIRDASMAAALEDLGFPDRDAAVAMLSEGAKKPKRRRVKK